MLSGTQLRMLRAATDESLQTFAEGCGVSHVTLSQIEKDTASPTTRTLEKILRYIDKKGYELTPYGGIQPRRNPMIILQGKEGFRNFMDDVYETAKEYGGEICLFNSKPSLWYKWLGEDWYREHAKRMGDLGDRISVKITVQKGDDFLILGSAQHRWLTENFKKEKVLYAYGPKIAFLDFDEEHIIITVIEHEEFTTNFKLLFNVAWEHITEEIKAAA